jgi:hypothetical protein
MIDMGKDGGWLLVHNPGDTPLYAVSFRMWDPADYAPAAKSSNGPKSRHMEVGNLIPRGARILGEITFPNSDSKDFKVTIRARNGGFTEWIKLRKVNGVWTRAVRVHPGDVNPSGSILYEFVDAGFPSSALESSDK